MSSNIPRLMVTFHHEGKLIAKTFFKKDLAKAMEKDLDKIVDTLYEGATSAQAGTRIWPTGGSKVDERIGVRLDWGTIRPVDPAEGYHSSIKYFRSFDLQINANAENQALLNEVQRRGTHNKRMTALIPLDANRRPLVSSVSMKSQYGENVLRKGREYGI
ncbi:hypothetical protein K474DRAFT_1680260 [Panus rudis PR-1116 ss-1]|nr:hypothetical protein K474DRAFT_1680260 [Panus rudis PR-1116 ss-1]